MSTSVRRPLLMGMAAAALVLLFYETRVVLWSVVKPLIDRPHSIETDFQYYYDAAHRFAIDRSTLYRSDDPLRGFAYPPPAILPFIPLTALSLGAALMWFTIGSTIAAVASLGLWLRHLRRHGVDLTAVEAVGLVVIGLALGPTYTNAVFGQVNTLVLLSAVCFIVWYDRAPVAAGIALALGTWLKIYPGLLFAVGLWDRRAFKSLAYAAVALVAIPVAALPIVPPEAYRTYATNILGLRLDATAVNVLNQSLVAFLRRFTVDPGVYLGWQANASDAYRVGNGLRATNWIAMIAAVLTMWRVARSGESARRTSCEAVLMASIAVFAPLGWGHTYVLALPLVVASLACADRAPAGVAVVIVAAAASLFLPASHGFNFLRDWPAWLQNVVYSRYLLSIVVLSAVVLYLVRYVTPIPGGRRFQQNASL